MKVILFGSNGMLGSYLKSYLSTKYEILALTRNDIDVSLVEEAQLLKFLHENINRDNIIINACGVIPQRGESNTKDTITVNSLFPQILAKFKQEIGCNVIHITTDCVFSGKKGGYTEEDPHDGIDVYGKSKSLGENPSITNIRTSVIGEEKRNKKSLLEWAISNRGKTIDGYTNHLWNGVTCLELAKLIDKIIEGNLYWEGVRHIFSPETVSKYDLLSMMNEIYDLSITIRKKITRINCYRDLKTTYKTIIKKPLRDQILELKEYNL